jgi:hypothetical protein
MDARYKNKALIGTMVGISLAGGWVLMSMHDRGPAHAHASASKLISIAMMLTSIPLYLWAVQLSRKPKVTARLSCLPASSEDYSLSSFSWPYRTKTSAIADGDEVRLGMRAPFTKARLLATFLASKKAVDLGMLLICS